MKPKILSSKIVHKNPWYQIRHDKLEWQNGTPGEYFVIKGIVSCLIIAEKNGKF
ncbi:MAG: hypothetical protein ABH820_01580 [Patescibacteria group bacterium]